MQMRYATTARTLMSSIAHGGTGAKKVCDSIPMRLVSSKDNPVSFEAALWVMPRILFAPFPPAKSLRVDEQSFAPCTSCHIRRTHDSCRRPFLSREHMPRFHKPGIRPYCHSRESGQRM